MPVEALWLTVVLLAHKLVHQLLVSCDWLQRDHSDFIQEAFVAVVECQRTYDGSSKFSTYARQAMRNRMIDLLKLRAVEYLHDSFDSDALDTATPDFSDDVLSYLKMVGDLKVTRDGYLLFTKLLGMSDSELGERNVAVRRHRAVRRFAALRAAA